MTKYLLFIVKIITKRWTMSDKDINAIWNFVPHFLYCLTTCFHKGPIIKLWCPEKEVLSD